MLNTLSEQQRERFYLLLILGVGLLRFINLGFVDMQAWDEALYAVRAMGILRFGGWMDQTPFAIDGLYSSLHPPLHVWFTAIIFHLIGVSEFSARFVSAVMGLLTLFIIYRIGKKLANAEVGTLAAMLFGLNPFVSFFARQGQFDATLVFFLTLGIYLLLESNTQSAVKRSMMAGIAIGAALMTKLYVALGIPVAYAVYMLLSKNGKQISRWKYLAIMSCSAIVVAAPWHLYMTVLHGNGDVFFFLNASALWDRSVSGIEGNVKPLEVLYFVNQLFVLFPAGVLWFAYGLWNTFRQRTTEWLLLASWFAVFFIVFSLMRTKLSVYLLPMLIPASLIAAREIWNVIKGEYSAKMIAAFIGGSLFSILWASSQSWRNEIKNLLLLQWSMELLSSLLVFIVIALTICFLFILLRRGIGTYILRRGLIYLFVVPSLTLSLYHVFYVDTQEYNDGGKELAEYISQLRIDRITVAGYERNPQLTYYLGGIDIGWREDIDFHRIIPPTDSTQFRPWLMEETAEEPPTALLVLEKDKFIRYHVVDPMRIIPPDYNLVLETRRYACFQKGSSAYFARK